MDRSLLNQHLGQMESPHGTPWTYDGLNLFKGNLHPTFAQTLNHGLHPFSPSDPTAFEMGKKIVRHLIEPVAQQVHLAISKERRHLHTRQYLQIGTGHRTGFGQPSQGIVIGDADGSQTTNLGMMDHLFGRECSIGMVGM
jgi:hypothetical protein